MSNLAGKTIGCSITCSLQDPAFAVSDVAGQVEVDLRHGWSINGKILGDTDCGERLG